jgi:short-subunit dehydrogenase
MARLALVTGASSGIGAETARALAARGFRVVLVARNPDRLSAIAASIGPAATVEPCDAADGSACLAMADRVRERQGVPDVIINSAGLGQWKRIEDTTPAEAAEMISAPYLAAFNVTHAFMRDMLQRGSGTLIHVNSPACFIALPAALGYTASRCALRGLHESLCQDLYGTGVRSCHVVFGKVASEYFEHNPGVEAHMPSIVKTVRTLSAEECGTILADVAERPRRQCIYPFMLRFYHWTYLVAPWLSRWLTRVTGARRVAA